MIEPVERARRKHEPLRSQLFGDIAIGRLRPGDVLPSEKRLAELLRISRHTVRKALSELERAGLLERLQGKGTFVVNRPGSNEQVAVRESSLALVVNELSTGFYPWLLAEFERAAKQVGRPTIVCSTGNEASQQGDHLMQLMHHRVAGVALNPCSSKPTPAYHVQAVQDTGIPVVLLHRSVPDVQAPVLVMPYREIGYRAGRMIAEAGHRRVAFFSGAFSPGGELCKQGFRDALGEYRIELPDKFIDHAPVLTCSSGDDYRLYEKHLENNLDRMLAGPDRPTAAYATFDSWAETLYLVAAKLGWNVPGDFSIVSCGGTRRQGAVVQRLTAITIDEAEEAQLAVQILGEMCDGRRPIRSSEKITLSLDTSLGHTLAPPC